MSEEVRGMGVAFDVEMILEFQAGGESHTAEARYVGDSQSAAGLGIASFGVPSYSSGELTIESPSKTVVTEHKYALQANYVPHESGKGWKKNHGNSPLLARPRAFTFSGGSSIDLDEVKSMGREVVDGLETEVFSATTSGLDIPGGRGDYDISYWFGLGDGLLRQVRIRGDLSINDTELFAQVIDSNIASIELTARFSDYGKEVDIITPEFPFFRYSHQAIPLEGGDVLAIGGFTGVANNNVIVPFPSPLAYLYSSGSGLWSIVGQHSLLEQEIGPTAFPSVVRLSGGEVLAIDTLPLGPDGTPVSGHAEVEEFPEVEEFTGAAFLFNTATNTWRLASSKGTSRSSPVLAPLKDGRVLIAGGSVVDVDGSGEETDLVELFNPKTGEWMTGASILSVPGGDYSSILGGPNLFVALLGDGRAMALATPDFEEAAGAEDAPIGGARTQVYDPISNTWEFTERSNLVFLFTGLIALSDGRILATGIGGSPSESDVYVASEIYDPATGQWTDFAEMTRVRLGFQLTLLPDGKVIATGGDDNFGDGLATSEVYDPATNTWSPGPLLSELRSFHSATLLLDGRIMLAGGIALETEKQEIYPTNSTEYLVIE